MNENLDLTELLKDCPEGTKFYSSYLGKDVFFIRIHNNDIEFKCPSKIDSPFDCMIEFRKNGSLCKDGECLIFPSKDQRDWSKWHRPFEDGDIVRYGDCIAIFNGWGDETLFRTYVTAYLHGDSTIDVAIPLFGKAIRRETRFATEEEKQKLFDAIESNGYKWNADKKKLEKLIIPKFWELVPNKFDPKTLKPFDKVLVRDREQGYWRINLFSHYEHNENNWRRYYCIHDISYKYCIPYNDDTKHLVGTDNEAPEYYRYWED